MKKKYVLIPILILCVVCGWLAFVLLNPSNEVHDRKEPESEQVANEQVDRDTEVESKEGSILKTIVNDEKLIENLKKQGKIPEDATREEIEEILKEYLKGKGSPSTEEVKKKENYINQLKKELQD